MGGREVDYFDRELYIRFVQNPNDAPDGYEIQLLRSGFYLPSRCLGDLTRSDTSTDGLMKKLVMINDEIPHILANSDVTPDQMHIAFLKVALKRAVYERDHYIEEYIENKNICPSCNDAHKESH